MATYERRRAEEPDMLYMGQTTMGRGAIMCTGPRSWTAMGLCAFLPVLLFVATLLYVYSGSYAIYVAALSLYCVSAALFILMVSLCIITWKVGYEYKHRRTHPRRHGERGDARRITSRHPRSIRAHRIHVMAPPPPPGYSEPGQLPPAYTATAAPSSTVSSYSHTATAYTDSPVPPPDDYQMFLVSQQQEPHPLSPPPPYSEQIPSTAHPV